MLLGLLLLPNISLWYNYYSSFSSVTTITSVEINTTINLYPSDLQLCSTDKLFYNTKNYLQYLNDKQLKKFWELLDEFNDKLDYLDNGNFTYSRPVTSTYRSGPTVYGTTTYVETFNSTSYNQAVSDACSSQRKIIDYVDEIMTKRQEQAKDIKDNLLNWDTYANNWKYEEAIESYEKAYKDLKDFAWAETIAKQVEDVIKDLKTIQEAIIAEENKQKLNAKYKEALEYWRNEAYDWAIKWLEDIIKNEWKIEWEYYDEAKHFLEEMKKWKELYWANKKYQEEAQQAEEQTKLMNEEVSNMNKAKNFLWTRAWILNSLLPIYNKKDDTIKKNFQIVLDNFKQSKDEYTWSLWTYMDYIIKYWIN